MPKPIPVVARLLAVALCAAGTAGCSKSEPQAFKTAKITRGDIVSTIEATGTLEPEDVVDIGARVTGQILSFGQDAKGHALDYGSVVEADQLLAKIDDVPYALSRQQAAAQLSLAEANMLSAKAAVVQAAASVAQQEAQLEQAQAQAAQAGKDWVRAQKAGTSSVMTQAAFDGFQGAFEAAKAGVKAAAAACDVARAQVAASQAGVVQAQSSVDQAKVAIALADRNLDYCTITSPVKGIIIDRRVDVGQTVVSNLNASSLFLLAKDLTKMQVWAPVNEADIGRVHAGQPVQFSVDAFPDRTFSGTVDKVRLNAAMTQNVVTYTVEINVDNGDGQLLPYLTANVKFEVARRTDALVVPNAALRWRPDQAQVAPGFEQALAAGKPDKPEGAKAGPKQKTGRVWVKDGAKGEQVRPVAVRLGINDGVLTEVTPVDQEAGLEGLEVVVGQESAESADAADAASSPFAPKFRGKKK